MHTWLCGGLGLGLGLGLRLGLGLGLGLELGLGVGLGLGLGLGLPRALSLGGGCGREGGGGGSRRERQAPLSVVPRVAAPQQALQVALQHRRLGCHGARVGYDGCARGGYAYPVRTVRGALWGQAALRLRYVPEAGTRSPYVPIRGPEAHASAQVVAGGSHAECSVEPKEYGLGESLGAPKANALGDGSFRERFPNVARSPESLVFPLWLAIRHTAPPGLRAEGAMNADRYRHLIR